jgi:hypothetical protein
MGGWAGHRHMDCLWPHARPSWGAQIVSWARAKGGSSFCSFFVEHLLNFIELEFVFFSLLSSASLDTNLVLGLGGQELGSTVERKALRRQGIIKIYLGFLFFTAVIGRVPVKAPTWVAQRGRQWAERAFFCHQVR